MCRAQPYVVPFLVRDYGFSEAQRAMILSSFTPGCALSLLHISHR